MIESPIVSTFFGEAAATGAGATDGAAGAVDGVAGAAGGVPLALDAIKRWVVVDRGSAVAANATTVIIELRPTTATAPTTEASKMRFIAWLSMVDQQDRIRHPLHTACLTFDRPFDRQCSNGVRDGAQVPEGCTAFASGRFFVR